MRFLLKIRYGRQILLLALLLAGCSLFEIPVPRLVDQFIRLGETSELADWLRRFEVPDAGKPEQFPVLPGMPLPLTTTQLQETTSSTLAEKASVLCFEEICQGFLQGTARDDSTLVSYQMAGTWSSEGVLLAGQGQSTWREGLQAAWHYKESRLEGYWVFEQPLTITMVTILYAGTLTSRNDVIIPDTFEMWDLYGHAVRQGNQDQSIRYETPLTTVAWPTPVSSRITNTQIRIFYPDGSSTSSRQWVTRTPLWDENLFFAPPSVTTEESGRKTSLLSYPPGEAYFSVKDTLTKGESRILDREIRTYNGLYHLLRGTIHQQSTRRMLVQVKMEMEPYRGEGFLQYQADRWGLFARWEGAIDEEDGSTLSFLMYRGPLGLWRLSTTYDFAPTEAFPDEELEMQYASDGSGWGEGVLIHSIKDNDVNSDFVDRFAASLAQPQPGARMSARD